MAPKLLTDLNNDVLRCIIDAVDELPSRPDRHHDRNRRSLLNLAASCSTFHVLIAPKAFRTISNSVTDRPSLANRLEAVATSLTMQSYTRHLVINCRAIEQEEFSNAQDAMFACLQALARFSQLTHLEILFPSFNGVEVAKILKHPGSALRLPNIAMLTTCGVGTRLMKHFPNLKGLSVIGNKTTSLMTTSQTCLTRTTAVHAIKRLVMRGLGEFEFLRGLNKYFPQLEEIELGACMRSSIFFNHEYTRYLAGLKQSATEQYVSVPSLIYRRDKHLNGFVHVPRSAIDRDFNFGGFRFLKCVWYMYEAGDKMIWNPVEHKAGFNVLYPVRDEAHSISGTWIGFGDRQYYTEIAKLVRREEDDAWCRKQEVPFFNELGQPLLRQPCDTI